MSVSSSLIVLVLDRRARCIHGREALVALECVCAARSLILDVHSLRSRVIDVHLYGRIAHDQVSTNDVSLRARGYNETVRITGHRVVLNDIVRRAAEKADAEIVTLSRISISTEPVPTEPVAAGAAVHSYTAAGSDGISVAHRNIAADLVRRSAPHQNAGEAIRG